MPGTLLSGLPALPGERVSVFGEPDSTEPVRIAIPVKAHLSFADLLTLLLKDGSLEYGELRDDEAVRSAVSTALLFTKVVELEEHAGWAMDVYHGRRAAFDYGGTAQEWTDWARSLGAAITRVFGIAA
ncbi:hypothetical protein [Streptomyces sp. Adlamb9]|uniref:hypothetical protein n=1 Tax=Streptomyces sp. Adlamb9 TaxID=3400629 RepID=UPI003F1A969B